MEKQKQKTGVEELAKMPEVVLNPRKNTPLRVGSILEVPYHFGRTTVEVITGETPTRWLCGADKVRKKDLLVVGSYSANGFNLYATEPNEARVAEHQAKVAAQLAANREALLKIQTNVEAITHMVQLLEQSDFPVESGCQAARHATAALEHLDKLCELRKDN